MAQQSALRFSYFQQVRKSNPHEFLFFDLGGLHH
jgi:hypothetical protein